MKLLENMYYRHPRLLVLTVAIILVGGLSAYAVLPRAEDPSLERRWATIKTTPSPARAQSGSNRW
jgi:multidrug efflux pump subunit AcrB